jgi:hypothetical protein
VKALKVVFKAEISRVNNDEKGRNFIEIFTIFSTQKQVVSVSSSLKRVFEGWKVSRFDARVRRSSLKMEVLMETLC